MLAFIEGSVDSASPLSVVLNANGIGYQIDIPVTTAEKLPPTGQSTRLFVHAVYREDSQALYGFASAQERDFFRLLVEKVSGIGPRTALNLMSRLSLPVLRSAIADSDFALIAQCPGIGRKTAERLCVDLRGLLGHAQPSAANASALSPSATSASSHSSALQDAVQALITLGFKADAADKAVRTAAAKTADPSPSADFLIKTALRAN